MCLVDLFPFAVDAECFRQRFDAHVAGVKAELVSYLSGRRQYGAQRQAVSELERTIDEHLDGKMSLIITYCTLLYVHSRIVTCDITLITRLSVPPVPSLRPLLEAG